MLPPKYASVSDIVNDSNFTTRLFDDDTVLMLNEKNLSMLNPKVNSELHKIQLWLSENELPLNYTKTTNMIVAPKRGPMENFSVLLNGNELSRCNSSKYLGITIARNLRWNVHIESLCKKLSQSAAIISKLVRHFVNFETLKIFITDSLKVSCYMEFFRGEMINYKSAIQPLQVLENKILRLMFKIETQSHCLYYSSYYLSTI